MCRLADTGIRTCISAGCPASSQVSDSDVGPSNGSDPTREKPMRLQPGLHVAVSHGRPTTTRFTAISPGTPLAWRPPIRLVGLLELLRRNEIRFA